MVSIRIWIHKHNNFQLKRQDNLDTALVPGAITVNAVPDDPDDDIIIACAIEAEADMIISGDQHLLSLGSYQGIPIIRAVDFLNDYTPPH